MSWASDNPELLEELTVDNLPEPYKTLVESGQMNYEDVPQDVMFEAMDEGIAGYWGDRIDEAMLREDLQKYIQFLVGIHTMGKKKKKSVEPQKIKEKILL